MLFYFLERGIIVVKSRKKLNDKIDVFDVIITDDKNFSGDNYSKGVNRRVIPITINRG